MERRVGLPAPWRERAGCGIGAPVNVRDRLKRLLFGERCRACVHRLADHTPAGCRKCGCFVAVDEVQ